LAALKPRDAALKISGDKLDILVDLAGHAEGSCMEILSYRPAPAQITTLGYFASVGAPFIDYVITDKFMMPLGKSERFVEKPLILHKHSALCYAPFDLSKPAEISAPIEQNAYPTFLCQQNMLKLSDDLLILWKQVFDKLGDFRLILQNKTISTKEGRAHLQKRLKNLGYRLSQITLLPFAKDYKETFKQADLALDTTPYPGGATTCEAIYNGLPTVTLRGNDPWSRLGASILSAAHLEELIADTPKDYANIMINLSQNTDKLIEVKSKLLSSLNSSRLMDLKGYSKELFGLYKKVYEES
jgi:predicted O-linked N-acetylglucosamine transferase (SPINDLY family)